MDRMIIIRETPEYQLEKLKEKLIEVKYKCYQAYLRILDDEYLAFEYADRHPCDLFNEYEWLMNHGGTAKVIEALEKWVADALYDDPDFNPINEEYWEACKPRQ